MFMQDSITLVAGGVSNEISQNSSKEFVETVGRSFIHATLAGFGDMELAVGEKYGYIC